MLRNSFYIVTLGCAKNEFDSAVAEKVLTESGFKKVRSIEEAEYIILNTCSFIEDAFRESVETAVELKRSTGKGQKFVFVGCLVNYLGEKSKELIEADYYLGTEFYSILPSVFDSEPGYYEVRMPAGAFDDYCRINFSGEKPWVYLKLAEGCSNRCSYCLIPEIRGPLKSLSLEKILTEAIDLVDRGAKELNFIAQDLASYGKDTTGARQLPRLLEELKKRAAGKKFWIRLLYMNPDNVDREFLEEIFSHEFVVPYLEMPVQSGSEKVLKEMGRRKTPDQIIEEIKYLRGRTPELVIRTTFLAGFPGETEDDFRETVEFLNILSPDYVSIFAYSDMEGIPSFRRKDKLPREVVLARANEMSEIAYRIMEEKASEKEGIKVEVLIEEVEGRRARGRAYFQAPEIDGFVYLEPAEKFPSEGFIRCELKKASGLDFEGEVVIS